MTGTLAGERGSLRRERCLVLGGSGFIGTNLCQRLRHSAASVRAFSRTPVVLDGVESISGDVADAAALARVLQGVDVVFHLIGSSTPGSSNDRIAADAGQSIVGSIELLEACRKAGAKRFVFASSGGTVYGDAHQVPTSESAPTQPISAYGVGKLAIEKYVALFERLHGMTGLVLRISNPYGPHQTGRHQQGLVGTVIRKTLSGEAIEIWGDGSTVRDYLFVDDLVQAFERAASYQGSGRVWNIGSGLGQSIREVIGIIAQVTGREPRTRFGEARSADVRRVVLDCSSAREQLGWSCTTSMEEGVARTFAWFQAAMPVSR